MKTRRLARNTNSTVFQFEGYINKFRILKNEGEDDKLIGLYVSFGPNRYARIGFSTSKFKGDQSILKEGEAYRFDALVTTDENVELVYKQIIDAKPLDREPVSGYKTRVTGRVKEIYPTNEDRKEVFRFECDSNNPLGRESYLCRYITDNAQSHIFKEGIWSAEFALKQTPDLLFMEHDCGYVITEEVEGKWVEDKDENGNVIMESVADGYEKAKMKKKIIKTFVETLEISSLTRLEE